MEQRQLGADIVQLIPGLSTSTPSDITAGLIVTKIHEAYSTVTASIISSGKLEYGHLTTTLRHWLNCLFQY